MLATPERPALPQSEAGAPPAPVNVGCRIALGFDCGRIRIGVAIGEAITGAARPLAILSARQHQPNWDALARLLTEWRPDWLVVGVPRHADASASASTMAALRFSRQLHGRFRLPVATVDERLSSWEAEQRYNTLPTAQRRRQRAAGLDAGAAAVILETWFQQRRSLC